MIVSPAADVRRLLRDVGAGVLVLLPYDLAVTLGYMLGGQKWIAVEYLPLPLLGSALALLVTIRNNTAYARWWEGRTLWGAITNNSRSFARGVLAMVADPLGQAQLVRLQIAYVRALRLHLLRRPAEPEIAPLLAPGDLARVRAAANVPTALQMVLARRLAAAGIDSVRLAALDATLSQLANAQGGLERIKNTPLPPHYGLLPRLFTVLFCLLLPLGLVADMEYFTPVGSTVIGFMFLAIDRIGRDLQNPFEGAVHDVPMETIVRRIEMDLLEAIGAPSVLPPLAVREGVLP